MARGVRIFSCVTSVPSTSAITRRIGFWGFVDVMRSSRALLLLIIPEQAAINKNCSTSHIAGFVGGQKNRDGGYIARLPKALERNIFQQSLQLWRVIQQRLVDRRFDRPGRNGIYGYAERRELNGKVARQHFDATFAGAIGGEMRKGQLFVNGTEVNDFAASLGLHLMFDECL